MEVTFYYLNVLSYENFLQPLNSCYEGAAQLKDILLVLSGYFILEILLFTIAYRRNRDII